MWPSQRVHTAGKGTLSSPGPACRSGRGHAEFMKHVKRQSPSAIAGAGLCTAFLTKEQLQGGDEQHPLWALSGSKQAKQAKMEPAGRNGMSAPQRVVANHEHQDSVLRSASCFIPILLHMLLENVSLSERNAGMKLPLFPSPCSPARGRLNSRPLLRSARCSPSHIPTGTACAHPLPAARPVNGSGDFPAPEDRPGRHWKAEGPLLLSWISQVLQIKRLHTGAMARCLSPCRADTILAGFKGWRLLGPT